MAGIPLRADAGALMSMERTSWTRAIAALALAADRRKDPQKITKAAWPDDQRALLITRGAVSPTNTSGFPTFDPVVAFRSLAPNSAALALFQLG